MLLFVKHLIMGPKKGKNGQEQQGQQVPADEIRLLKETIRKLEQRVD